MPGALVAMASVANPIVACECPSQYGSNERFLCSSEGFSPKHGACNCFRGIQIIRKRSNNSLIRVATASAFHHSASRWRASKPQSFRVRCASSTHLLSSRLVDDSASAASRTEALPPASASHQTSRRQQLIDRHEIPEALGHLLALDLQEAVVHPVRWPSPACRGRSATGRSRSRGGETPGRCRRRGCRTPRPRCFSAIAEHSMCQPGRPASRCRPARPSDGSPACFDGFHSTKSMASRL